MSSTPSSSTSTPQETERKRRPENIDIFSGKRMLASSMYNFYTNQWITIDYTTGKRTVRDAPRYSDEK